MARTGEPLQSRLVSWPRTLMREMTEGGLIVHAKALVYTTLLSFVPLLAVSFSVLKAFGFHNQLKPFLIKILAPLGENGIELGNNIVGFVQNVQVGVLGSIGIVMLIYSVVSTLEIIKDSFNHIWRTGETRTWLRRVSDYLSILLIGPVLVFSALGVMASMENSALVQSIVALEPLGTFYYWMGLLVPYALIISAFTFFYMFMPCSKVGFKSALIGGILGGVGWKAAGWVFATFVTQSASYNAIYSGFAIVILFMFWLYVSWLTLLLGGAISFYHQHPIYLHYFGKCPELSHREQEFLGFFLMYLIGRAHYDGKAPWTVIALSDAVSLPWETVRTTLKVLEQNEILVSLKSEPESFLPAKAPETLELTEIYRALRKLDVLEERRNWESRQFSRVAELMTQMEQSAGAVLNGLTLRDLLFDVSRQIPK
ncbi:MAG: YhjD/YihY/BrkB family envelope integrity protein [Gammaproteobacteria bacterium]